MTWEPLSNIIADGPYSCVVYGKKFDLLSTQGWKQLKRHARTAKRLPRTLKKSKYRQAKVSRRYKHGWEVPGYYAHVEKLQFSFILISCCPEIHNSLGSSGIFPKDCLFTCIFHSL